MRRTVAVTGAAGCVGRALLERLDPQDRVRALVRREDGFSRCLRERGGEVVLGDLDDRVALAELVRGADVVYHCAATMAKGDYATSRRVNVAGTENLALAALESGVSRFVYVSSISVYAATRRPDGVLTEEVEPANLDRLNHYSFTKYQAELTLRRLGRRCGLPFTIIRPTNVYGPWSVPWFRQPARLLERMPVVVGDIPIDLVYVDDVAAALVQAADSPAAVNETFNVGHEMALLREFFARVARVTGRRAIAPPAPLDRLARTLIDTLYRGVTGKHMSLSLVRPAVYPHAKARRAFGYEPRIGLDEGFAALARWYRGLGGS